jgi:DNA mismatch repair protein MutS
MRCCVISVIHKARIRKVIQMAEFSPMMQHYLDTKKQYSDCVLFYRLGDFYEMFYDDAEIVSRELELTLTGKDCGQEKRAPMSGIPFHAAEGYIGIKLQFVSKLKTLKQQKEW